MKFVARASAHALDEIRQRVLCDVDIIKGRTVLLEKMSSSGNRDIPWCE